MSVIGVAPWGVITGRDDIVKHGIGVGIFFTREPLKLSASSVKRQHQQCKSIVTLQNESHGLQVSQCTLMEPTLTLPLSLPLLLDAWCGYTLNIVSTPVGATCTE